MYRWENNQKFEILGDSSDYDVLERAAKRVKGVEGLVLEIGVRRGAGIFSIMKAMIENDDFKRKFIGVDPYGHQRADWTNAMKCDAKRNLYAYAWEKKIDFTLLELEDIEFFDRFKNGIPIYNRVRWDTKGYVPEDNEWKELVNKYSIVHLDGPHRLEDVILETNWLLDGRLNIGSVVVYDDVNKPKNTIILSLKEGIC